jgi:hypothetical protein
MRVLLLLAQYIVVLKELHHPQEVQQQQLEEDFDNLFTKIKK